MRMYTLKRGAERLVTIYMPEPPSLVEARQFATELGRMLVARAPERSIMACDFRCDEPYTPEVRTFLIAMMCQDNEHIERSIILVAANTIGLQIFNAVQDAKSPRRKVDTDARKLVDWLAEVCSDAEAEGVRRHILGRNFST